MYICVSQHLLHVQASLIPSFFFACRKKKRYCKWKKVGMAGYVATGMFRQHLALIHVPAPSGMWVMATAATVYIHMYALALDTGAGLYM